MSCKDMSQPSFKRGFYSDLVTVTAFGLSFSSSQPSFKRGFYSDAGPGQTQAVRRLRHNPLLSEASIRTEAVAPAADTAESHNPLLSEASIRTPANP